MSSRLHKKCLRSERRLGLWRSVCTPRGREIVYVSLIGEVYRRGRDSHSVASRDKELLHRHEISDAGESSRISDPSILWKNVPSDETRVSHWFVPESVERQLSLIGVASLYPWQVQCLHTAQQAGRYASLVYGAPTSGGKSLVAELIALRGLLYEGRRILFVLPHISLVSERTRNLKQLWGEALGLRICAFHSLEQSTWSSGVDVAVCTLEKANGLLNRILVGSSLTAIGCVIVDEIHLLSDASRGFLLEMLLIKLLRAVECSPQFKNLQILAMSATIPNISELASWLRAHHFVTPIRPLPLIYAYKLGNQVFEIHGNEERSRALPTPDIPLPGGGMHRDPDHLGWLCWEMVKVKKTALVFCASKDWTVNAAKSIAGSLNAYRTVDSKKDTPDLITRRQSLAVALGVAGATNELMDLAADGVAFHNSSLTKESRSIVEKEFIAGTLVVLVTTSTLAVGVNLPVSRVIFRSPTMANKPLDSAQFKQMAGRAGRQGFDARGEAIAMATPRDLGLIKSLIHSPPPNVVSVLGKQRLSRSCLELIVTGLAASLETLIEVLSRCSLMGRQHRIQDMEKEVETALVYLETQAMVTITRPDAKGEEIRFASALSSPLVLAKFFQHGPNVAIKLNNRFKAALAAFNNLSNWKVENQKICRTWIVKCTPIGSAAVEANLRLAESLERFSDLFKARMQGLYLDTELHLLFMCSPEGSLIRDLRWSNLMSIVHLLPDREKAVAEFLGVVSENASKVHFRGSAAVGDCHEAFLLGQASANALCSSLQTSTCRRFFLALIVLDLLRDVPVSRIADRYKVSKGDIEHAKAQSMSYCGSLASFCARLGWEAWRGLFSVLGQKLATIGTNVKPEAQEIMAIELVVGQRANALVTAGLDTVEKLAQASVQHVADAMLELYRCEVGTVEGKLREALMNKRRSLNRGCCN